MDKKLISYIEKGFCFKIHWWKKFIRLMKCEKKYTIENLIDVLSNTVITTEQLQELRRKGFQVGK